MSDFSKVDTNNKNFEGSACGRADGSGGGLMKTVMIVVVMVEMKILAQLNLINGKWCPACKYVQNSRHSNCKDGGLVSRKYENICVNTGRKRVYRSDAVKKVE